MIFPVAVSSRWVYQDAIQGEQDEVNAVGLRMACNSHQLFTEHVRLFAVSSIANNYMIVPIDFAV